MNLSASQVQSEKQYCRVCPLSEMAPKQFSISCAGLNVRKTEADRKVACSGVPVVQILPLAQIGPVAFFGLPTEKSAGFLRSSCSQGHYFPVQPPSRFPLFVPDPVSDPSEEVSKMRVTEETTEEKRKP